jgi:hypothetical protein
MPDTGPSSAEPEPTPPEERSPDAVRHALAAFQGGVEYGRAEDEHTAPPVEPAAEAVDQPPPAPVGEPLAMPAPAVTAAPVLVPAPRPAEPAPIATAPVEPAKTTGGLSRRVKGANMFDTGPAADEPGPVVNRSADEVRSALSSFQLGQHQAAKETASPDHGNQ